MKVSWNFLAIIRSIEKRRSYAIIILVIISASLVLILRGSVPQRNALQVDALNYVESVDANSLGPEIWLDNLAGQTQWQLSLDNGTEGQLSFNNNSLNLTAFFSGTSGEQAVSVYRRPLNVSFNENPTAVATISVSKGIHYGMRFSGVEPGNQTFQAWYESSPLQHRLGVGTIENLTANLALDTYIASGQFPPENSTITSAKFYLEAVPGQTGWFSLILSHIAILPNQQKPYSDGGTYNGLVVRLGSAFAVANPFNESLFQAYVGYRIQGTPNLQYRLYFSNQLVTEAEGYVYHLKPISDYEVAVLYPWNVHDFPSVYSNLNESYVSVVALQGSITYFHLDTLIFDYLTQTIVESAGFDPNSAQILFAYYIVFLFVTPIAMSVLFGRAFRNEQETTNRS